MTDVLRLKFFKYFEIAKISLNQGTAYIGDVFGMAGLIVFRIWLLSQLYTQAFLVVGAAQIGVLTLKETIWVLALTQIISSASRSRHMMRAIEHDIKSGSIAQTISRPYSYLLFNFSSMFGMVAAYILPTLILGVLVTIALVGTMAFPPTQLLVGGLLAILGFAVTSLIVLSIGLLAFWTEDVSAFRWIYDKFVYMFGGTMLPLTIFPDHIRSIIEFLPFNLMGYASARLMVSFDSALFIKYLLSQIFWIVVLSLLVRWMYSRAIKNLSINGG